MNALLRVEALGVAGRSGQPVLVHDVRFGLADGEVLGIVGESGSGKSLTCLALAGLLDRSLAARGSLEVDGVYHDLAATPGLAALRGATLGMIFQDPRASLNPVRTVGAHFDEVLRRHGRDTASVRRDRAMALMESMRIPAPRQRLRQYPHELSGGLCQRLSIALALAARPRVLIADEPTTALDTTVQAQILDLIDLARADHGMAVILVSHDLAVVSELADRLLVMRRGRVVETAGLVEIFERPQTPYARRLVSLACDRHGTADIGATGSVPAARG